MIVRAHAALDVEVLAVVDDPADHLVHVVGLAVGLGQHVEQLLVAALDRIGDRQHRRALLAVRGEEREVLPDARDALLVVGHLDVADAGLAAVDARAAELLLRDVLADRRAHEMRPGQRHRAAALDHRDEVGEARDVGGAGGARAHQRGDLRDHPAHHHLLAEQVAGAGEQRADRLLDARARGVEQPHERHALLQRQLAQARDLQLAGHPHRAGHHREVVGADAGHPAVDAAVAGDHPVGGRVAAVHRALGEVRLRMDAQLGERALVDQQRDPLARGQLAGGVLARDPLLPAAEPRQRAPLGEVLGERAHAARGFRIGAHA